MSELALEHDTIIDVLHDPVALGKSLRLARKSAGMTQEEAAAHLDIARTTLVAIEQGQRHVKAEELYQMATLYKCDIANFTRTQQELPSLPILSARKRVLKRVFSREPDSTMYNTLCLLAPTEKEMERMAATLLHMLIQLEEDSEA